MVIREPVEDELARVRPALTIIRKLAHMRAPENHSPSGFLRETSKLQYPGRLCAVDVECVGSRILECSASAQQVATDLGAKESHFAFRGKAVP